jgi:hypothetical protein
MNWSSKSASTGKNFERLLLQLCFAFFTAGSSVADV